MELKSCSYEHCQQVNPQPIENFIRKTSAKDGLSYICRQCDTSRRRSKYVPKKNKNRNLKAGNIVPIESLGKRKSWSLAVDHDHATGTCKTGKIRGLLCLTCNLALGHARDSTTLMRVYINYLNKFKPLSNN